jgi:cytochrome P450
MRVSETQDRPMTGAQLARGIPAGFDPVDWNPPGLPTDPQEIVSCIANPATRGELYPLYHQLRRVAPVFRNDPKVFHGAWTFTRFGDADQAFKNSRVVNDPQVVDEAFDHGDGTFQNVMRDVMVWQEPEPHQRVRNLVKAAFTKRAIARFRPVAEQVARELCDRIEPNGQAELVSQFNYELPFIVIARILGVPDDDFPQVKQLAWDFARGAEKVLPADVARRADDAARGFEHYFGELAEIRRANPRDDLLSSLLAAEADGERLTHRELVANCILLLQAGHETTQDLLGNAEVALFRSPSQLELLRDHPELTASAVEEFLRYDGSVQINHRLALDGLAPAGTDIAPGEMIYIFLGAVNRDPVRFRDPDRLDITRDNTHHLAFSFGAYYCLGAALARTEVAVGIRTLLDRFSGLRPAGDSFEWRDTLQLRGPLRLDATW